MKATFVFSVVVALTWLHGARHDALAGPPEALDASITLGQRSLRQHFGVEVARRLMHAPEPGAQVADTLRGIERAASLGTPDAPALLVQLLADPRGLARSDIRVLLAATRALAPFVNERGVARALADFVMSSPSIRPAVPRSGPEDEAAVTAADLDRRARLEIARETAALALAQSTDERAVDVITAAARGGGPGQRAATLALRAYPPSAIPETLGMTPTGILIASSLGDLRANELLIQAGRWLDPGLRAAALLALGAAEDARVGAVAKGAVADPDPAVRRAAATALVDIGSAEAPHAVRGLLEDEATAEAGVELSSRTSGDEVTGALAALIRVSSDRTLRVAAVVALGRRPDPKALRALTELMVEPVLAGDAAEAVARSPLPAAWDVIERRLLDPSTRRMGARMSALRGRHSKLPPEALRALRRLAEAPDPRDRAVGMAALVLLGRADVQHGLIDPDPRVRRTVALACDATRADDAAAMLRQRERERDPLTRLILSGGLLSGAEAELVSTTDLLVRAREGDVDAPASVFALARRAEETERSAVDAALVSPDPVLRAHAARGLEGSPDPTASGRLAEAYEEETDAATRRIIVLALARRTADRGAPLRDRALDRAARLDPDASIRALGRRGLLGLSLPEPEPANDLIWMRAMTTRGMPPAPLPFAGVVSRSDGVGVPVAFDEDGYLLMPAPPGPARLVLAPRLAAYEALRHDD